MRPLIVRSRESAVAGLLHDREFARAVHGRLGRESRSQSWSAYSMASRQPRPAVVPITN
jgi:hypothetical protein